MTSLAALILTALAAATSVTMAEDVWEVPALEATVDAGVSKLLTFPATLAPRDLEEEVAAALETLGRIDRDSASRRARALLASADGAVVWAARRVLIEASDLETIRFGLRSYFDDEAKWREALSVSEDVRLRAFRSGRPEGETPTERHFESLLERNLSLAREPAAIRALLAWASGATDAAPPRRVLEALPEGVPYERSIRRWLQSHPRPPEVVEPPLFGEGDEALAIQERILSLGPRERDQAIRVLAENDHEALLGHAMSGEEVDRVFPYLARSSRRALRDRVRRAKSERGRALAALLLASSPAAEEKREAVDSMKDAWAAAVAAGGPPVFEELSRLVSPDELERFLTEGEPDEMFLEALAIVPLPGARLRLEALGTADAIERLAKRPDRILSIPALVGLRRSSDPRVADAVERVLLSLGAPGATARLRLALGSSSDLESWLGVLVRAPLEPELVFDAVRAVARTRPESPAVFAALFALEERYPSRLLSLLGEGGLLAERARLAMALSSNSARVPLWIDTAVGADPHASGVAREAAFSALAEAELGSFAGRLHRLAGHPEREIRFRAAAALVPSGEAWMVRLLLGNVDPSSACERSIARRALERLGSERARALLEEMVADGTAGVYGALAFLELSEASSAPPSPSLEAREALEGKLWELIAVEARASNPAALLAASRLSLPEAIAVVGRRLTPP